MVSRPGEANFTFKEREEKVFVTMDPCEGEPSSKGEPISVHEAWHLVARQLLDERNSAGHWIGELSTSALSTATAISAICSYRNQCEGKPPDESVEWMESVVEQGVQWLADQQNEDGGWGDTDLSYSNISTTMLVLASWRLSNTLDRWPKAVDRARGYISKQGGVEGLRRRYGEDKTFAVPILANAAIAGEVDWKTVPVLPFEAACVPQSWYRFMQMPVVSYAIPALVAIGQAKYRNDPPRNPLSNLIRKLSVSRTLRVLQNMQPSSGGFLEAIPLTSFVVMGLSCSGHADHPVVENGLRFIRASVRSEGSWPIDTNLATWNTSLSISALSQTLASDHTSTSLTGGAHDRRELLKEMYRPELLDWLLGCQNLDRHPFTGAKPGGWGWSDLSGAVPDADDTPGALIALRYWADHANPDGATLERIRKAVRAGGNWLLALQNRDGGWPTFCRGWGKLPFDRSGSDLTAHAMRALNAWKAEFPESVIEAAFRRGWRYLERQQRPDGSWLPLWFGNQDLGDEENPLYGTVKVLLAFRDFSLEESAAAQRGRAWLTKQQHADGSWGGGRSITERSPDLVGSIEETALALEILADGEDNSGGKSLTDMGLRWLCDRVREKRYTQPSPIGFYFAKLWYHERLYPQIFTAAALSRACRVQDDRLRAGTNHHAS
ncbi:MAG: prenyltransferase/squalene oxidase repeat-containing protein [Planctomycetota bacterium]|nr:prenyltransferase/squalene oxidase repeat-containing protein [Planctomycetota bacterium]